MELKEIVEMNVGLIISRKEAKKPDKTYKVYNLLTTKCILDEGILDSSLIQSFNSKEEIDEKYLTQENDIILKTSYPYTSFCIDKNNTNLLISSNFIILRLKENLIFNSKFIAIYMNSDKVKSYLSNQLRNSAVPGLKISDIGNIKIPQISKKEQEKIVEFQELFIDEMKMYQNLIHNKYLLNKKVMHTLLD